MALIVLRHTRPERAEGLCYGRTDLPLGADFEAEADRLSAELPKVSRILSSPLSRCRRLAERLGAARALTVEVEPRLVEIDFGSWENRPWAALPREEIDAWADDLLHARPHGGETVAELAERVAGVLDAALAAGERTLLVAHAGVARAALAWDGAAEPWQAPLDFGAWLTLSRRAPSRSSGSHSPDLRPA